LNVQAADKWIMSVQEEDLAPFKHRNGNGPGGIEVDLVAALAFELGRELEFKSYSIPEGRAAFEKGEVNIDCCLNRVWFPREEAKAVQLFSDPLYRLLEVWVFPKGKSFRFKSVEELKNKRVIGIKGFNYPGEEHYGTRIDGTSPLDVLEKLLAGEGDVAVLERHVTSYLINRRKLKAEFGELYYAVDVSVRLHKTLVDDLPAINEAIKKLKANGTIDDIIRRNLF
jgi:ABC-type amino acid transport substrate-binding protein